MNRIIRIPASIAVFLAAAVAVRAAEPMTMYVASPGGNLVRIDGTANHIHPTWIVQGTIIAGMLSIDSAFPIEAGQTATPGKVSAQANVGIRVGSLKSVEADGKPYSDKMDEVMYEHVKADKNPFIRFHLDELTLKEAPKSKDAPFVFEAKGNLTIAGVTKPITMPVEILPVEGKKLKITGSVSIKTSAFNAGPVNKSILGIHLTTGDDVKVSFVWMLHMRPGHAATAAK